LGYRCISYKNTKNIAQAHRAAINSFLLNLGLKYEPKIPPTKVLMAHIKAMMRDYFTILIIDR